MALRELAKRADFAVSHISNIENGIKEPGSNCLKGIAHALDVTVEYLLNNNTKYTSADEAAQLESLRVFVQRYNISQSTKAYMQEVFLDVKIYNTVEAWRAAYQTLGQIKGHPRQVRDFRQGELEFPI